MAISLSHSGDVPKHEPTIIIGMSNENIDNGGYNLIIGTKCTVKGHCNVIIGQGHLVAGSNNVIISQNPQIVNGDNHTIVDRLDAPNDSKTHKEIMQQICISFERAFFG